MVDADRVRHLLSGIEADIRFLDGYSERGPAQLLEDDALVRGIKYTFITAIEGCARVAHHIVAAEGWSPTETNADAVRQLGREGVLAPELAASIAEAVGFRNLLVHQYGDIDDERAIAHLARLRDLREFTTSVARWLEAGKATGG